ncbi:MAG TPA: adenylate/guanylate cyclase domain-containing protein [Acidimicrobiales bacterium]|nr:adenylate/guanylate cyclase domain-containing protein [Acidimicrobiales bacterium]
MSNGVTPPDDTHDRLPSAPSPPGGSSGGGPPAIDPERRDQALQRVRSLLLELGATEQEIDAAVADDVVDLLVVDRMLIPAERRMTQAEVLAMTGMQEEPARRIWRALGFLDVDEDDRAFTDMDVEALELFKGLTSMGLADFDSSLQMIRVIGSSMARIAEATTARGTTPVIESSGDSVVDADVFSRVLSVSLPTMARLLEFVWRRHLQAATRREMLIRTRGTVQGISPVMAVGFVDMVGYTMLSQHLADSELAAVVARFEELARDTVTSLGGRVVKMIGDEAMFVVSTAADAARIGLSLAEAYADDELLSDVRVALSTGPVLLQDGDYYGPVVNVASRLVGIANPGTVLMTDEFYQAIQQETEGEFVGHALRPRNLKGIGWVQVWKLSRVGSEPGADSRRNLRWERFGEVIREIDELRNKGEKLMVERQRRSSAEQAERERRHPAGGAEE